VARDPRPAPGAIHVALLRGINVGGKRVVAMADLAAMFTAAGARGVKTYIQSGNVVFAAPPAGATAIAAAVRRRIAAAHGFDVPIVLRTRAELAAVARANPFIAAGEPEARLHVGFLAEAPTAARIASLDPDRSPPDTFAVRGAELYLCVPNGMGKTRLTAAYVDTRLATTSTFRNWRTVLALVELATAATP